MGSKKPKKQGESGDPRRKVSAPDTFRRAEQQPRFISVSPMPPELYVDEYKSIAIDDVEEGVAWPAQKGSSHYVYTTQRDRIIDHWLDAERWLRGACVLLLSPPDASLQAQVWGLVEQQRSNSLIRLSHDLLTAKGHDVPANFSNALGTLAHLRNVLAHQVSRPREARNPQAREGASPGITFMKVTGFRTGQYVHVTFHEIERVIAAVEPIVEWLIHELPECDQYLVESIADSAAATEPGRLGA
jgi:hypothetical protein